MLLFVRIARAMTVALLISVASSLAADAGEMAPPVLLGQFDLAPSEPASGNGLLDWRMPVKGGVLLLVALGTIMVSYFVLYPTFLRRGRVWPLTLFGRCTALAWCVVCLAALFILWDDLTWSDEFGGTNFWREHGGRLGVVAAGVGFAVVWMYLWRSDAPQKSDPTALTQ